MSNVNVIVHDLHIETRETGLYVNGRLFSPADGAPTDALPSDRELVLDRDGQIKGDVRGNLSVNGAGKVTLVSDGDVQCTYVEGNVRAQGTVQVGTIVGTIEM